MIHFCCVYTNGPFSFRHSTIAEEIQPIKYLLERNEGCTLICVSTNGFDDIDKVCKTIVDVIQGWDTQSSTPGEMYNILFHL